MYLASRYVGVMWCGFHVLHLLLINYTQETCVAWVNITLCTTIIIIPLIHLFLLEVHACLFLNWTQMSSQSCSLLEHMKNIYKRSPTLLKMCVFMMFALWYSLNHTSIKYKGPIKKSNWITPTCLIGDWSSLGGGVKGFKIWYVPWQLRYGSKLTLYAGYVGGWCEAKPPPSSVLVWVRVWEPHVLCQQL